MASYERCIQAITQAVGRELSVDEAKRLDKQVTKLIDKLNADKHVDDFDNLLLKAVADAAEQAEVAALIQKRNAVKNLVAKVRQRDRLDQWSDQYDEGLQALLGGSMTGRKGAKLSTATAQDALANSYQMGWASDLDAAGVTKIFASGEYDEAVYVATHELGKKNPDQAKLAQLPKEAVAIARINEKWNEVARLNANKAGAWIEKLPGYVTKQSHDAAKIRPAGADTWIAHLVDGLDWEKTLPDVPVEQRTAFLRNMWGNLASSRHVVFSDGPTTGFQGHANIGKTLSHERILHFKSPEAEYAYQQTYGRGSLRESMFYGLGKLGRETALMRDWGPNAIANYTDVVNDTLARLTTAGDMAQKIKVAEKDTYLKRVLWPFLTGAINAPENATWARYSANVRAIESMADLGGAMLSSITDLPVLATAGRQQGVGMLRGIAGAVRSLFESVSSGERASVLSETGILLDSLRVVSGDRWDVGAGQVGSLAKMVNTYFKLNLLSPWTDRLRGGFVLATAHRLANHSDRVFADLPAGMQHLLQQYEIGHAEWNIIRQATESHADGKAFITPEGLASLQISETVKADLQTKLRTFYQDQATTAVVEPNTMTKAMLLGGAKPGTGTGEAMRHFWMYKSFTMSIMRQVMGRELFGYGQTRGTIAGALFDMVKHPTGSPMVGMANLIAFSTVFGYAAMVLKDFSKGREPHQPEEAGDAAKLLGQAMAQGGGMGIYGDFLFGEAKSRFGHGPLETFLGPSWRRLSDVKGVYDALKTGDDPMAKAITSIFNSTPFVNLFYTRWALDYLVLYRLQEMMNPGYLQRMEQRLRNEKQQEYVLPPSQVIPYGG